jgi:endonuclease G
LREARHARDIASAYYLYNPRVTLIDIGWKIEERRGGQTTGELAVRVHMRHKPRGLALEAFVEHHPRLFVDKKRIPFPVVDIVERSYPLQRYWYYAQPPPRGRLFDRLRGGISISSEWSSTYGTLGGIVVDRDSGDPMILSNWHVLAGSAYAPKGLGIYQPGYGDGGRAQHLVAHLERHVMNDNIDAAVAKLTPARPWVNDEFELGPVLGSLAPMVDMRVTKSGRGSGITTGIIDGIEGEYPVPYAGLWRKIKYVHRIVARHDEASRGGDSGSWWLEEDSRKAVGLHFAGYDSDWEDTALAMAMPQVLDALNIEIPPRDE